VTVLFEKVFGPLKTLVLVAKKSRWISKPDFFDLSISLVRIPAASTVQTNLPCTYILNPITDRSPVRGPDHVGNPLPGREREPLQGISTLFTTNPKHNIPNDP
jgi:hypothetical protein